jgi:hypothetical protein
MGATPPIWSLNRSHASEGQFQRFFTRHPREFASLFNNLNKIMILLNSGLKAGGFHVGFFRSEGDGVYRIGQTGVESAKECRLYVFPDSENAVMYVLESERRTINNAI